MGNENSRAQSGGLDGENTERITLGCFLQWRARRIMYFDVVKAV